MSGYRCVNCTRVFPTLDELRMHNITGHGEAWPKSLAVYIADTTSDAYSWDMYEEARWLACVRMMLKRGYNEREVEAILRSKYMRWTADTVHPKRPNSADLARFLDADKKNRQPGGGDVNELVAGTFGE